MNSLQAGLMNRVGGGGGSLGQALSTPGLMAGLGYLGNQGMNSANPLMLLQMLLGMSGQGGGQNPPPMNGPAPVPAPTAGPSMNPQPQPTPQSTPTSMPYMRHQMPSGNRSLMMPTNPRYIPNRVVGGRNALMLE